jgi:LysM repeat protein
MIQNRVIIKTVQLIIITVGWMFSLNAQTITTEQYIEQYKDIAMLEMKRMGVPASITLAQGLLESESGNSDLVKKSNNHFGIKCKSNWTGEGVTHDDDSLGECFRKYPTAEESFRDHSNFLKAGKHYSFLFDLDITDYKGWAYGLKKAGYATNPKYPVILINYIEKYNLQRFNLVGAEGLANVDSEKLNDGIVMAEQKKTTPVPDISIDRGEFVEADIILSGDPDVIGIVNGSKCIKALKGTSLLAIATRYNISLQRLLIINELDDGLLDEDQLIYLQKKSTKGNKDFIILRKNETYYSIAQNNGIQLEKLLEYNHLNEDDDVLSGTKVYLKPTAQLDLTKTNSIKSSGTIFHKVKAKEGLYGIAQKYNVSVKQLKKWNRLSSENLQIGQQLIVSQ